jgi:hypothetical protein
MTGTVNHWRWFLADMIVHLEFVSAGCIGFVLSLAQA